MVAWNTSCHSELEPKTEELDSWKKNPPKNWPFRKVANKSNQSPKKRNYVKTADHMASEKVTAGFSAFVMSVTLWRHHIEHGYLSAYNKEAKFHVPRPGYARLDPQPILYKATSYKGKSCLFVFS